MDAILTNTVYSFLLILTRFSGLFLTTPIFSNEMIPAQVKIGFSILCSMIFFPIVFANGLIEFPSVPLGVVFHLANELLIGIVIGFVALLTFTVFQMAGQFIDFSIGFSMVNVIDPIFGEDSPIMGQFNNLLAMLILLTINGHHEFIRAVNKSFEVIPVTRPVLTTEIIDYVLKLSGEMFLIGFRFALPIVATIYIVDFVFGFIARTVPQMNIFILGFPVKILLGIGLVFLSIPLFVGLMTDIIRTMNDHVFKILMLFK